MKKVIFIFSALLISAFFISSCSEKTTASKTNTTEPVKVVYTCPMHPEVISDKPGVARSAEWI